MERHEAPEVPTVLEELRRVARDRIRMAAIAFHRADGKQEDRRIWQRDEQQEIHGRPHVTLLAKQPRRRT